MFIGEHRLQTFRMQSPQRDMRRRHIIESGHGYHVFPALLNCAALSPAPACIMPKPRYNSPEEAESAFYHSFESGDPKAMMKVWDQTDDIICIHPFGTRLEGVRAVRDAWTSLLKGRQRLSFQVESRWNYASGDLVIHAVLERIRIQGDDTAHTPIIATNAYRRTTDGWRMVLHHASPQPKPGSHTADDQDGGDSGRPTIH